MRRRLKTVFYNHFMILSSAIQLLISPKTCYTYNNVAIILLNQFISNYPLHYRTQYVDYNGLIHIVNFILIHGSLDNFSAFKYQNYFFFLDIYYF